MRTGRHSSDSLMLVVPIVVSCCLIVIITGGVESFVNLADIAIRDAVTAAVSWIRAL